MKIERRGEGNQVPESLDDVLNEMQLVALRTSEGLGWNIAFIRRPLFQDIVPVLFHPDTDKLITLEGNGEINSQPNIVFR